MALVFLGTDFRGQPTQVLEQLEATSASLQKQLVSPTAPIAGAVVLATCNRFEIYLDTDAPSAAIDFTKQRVAENFGHSPAPELAELADDQSIRHLFAVASGIESMVAGEAEIAGQVKRALSDANKAGTLTPDLHRVFQVAARVSKSVANETQLAAEGRSIIGSAMDQVSEELGSLADLRVLLIGTGGYARVVASSLERHGADLVTVYSRAGRAEAFAQAHGWKSTSTQDFVTELAQADLVISASGRPGYVVNAAQVKAARNLVERAKPQYFIDVALARDIDPEVENIANCRIIDLEQIGRHTVALSRSQLAAAHQIIDEGVAALVAELKARSVDPAITALREQVTRRIRQEVESVRRKSGSAVAHDVERALNRVTNAILHDPTVRAKELAKVGQEADYLDAVRLIFNLEVDGHE